METKLRMIALLEKHKEGLHLRALSRMLKTGLPNVTRYANILEKEQVVKKQKDANLVKLRLKEGQKTVAYLKQVNTERFLTLPGKVQLTVSDFLKEVETKPVIALIFGSYAKGTHTRNSDIDLLLVFQNVVDGHMIDNTAKRISMRTGTKLSSVYLDYEHFESGFLDKNHDFSKEIRHNAIVVSGVELYNMLLWRYLS